MRKRDFLVALAVAATLAAPGFRGLYQAAGNDEQPEPVAIEGPPTPAPTPRIVDVEKVKITPNPQATFITTPEGDGCPSCGMARIETRGQRFLNSYTQ